MPAMWDRLRTTGSSAATNPSSSSVGKTGKGALPDDDFWNEKGLGISSPVRYHIQRGVAVRDHPPEYDQAPAVQQPPPRNPRRTSYRDSSLRPASSVYSQPSPTNARFTTVASRNETGDISPPSSPELGASRDGPRHHRDVSPIDEAPDLSSLDLKVPQQTNRPSSSQRSNIPTMRRDRRKQQDAAATNLREMQSRERLRGQAESPAQQKSDTRWDAMTGEPTTKATGRAGQVKPAEYAQGFGQSPAASIASRNAPPPASQSFGDRVKRMKPPSAGPAPTAAPLSLETRPEWKGGSGRSTIVNPVRDMPEVAPLNIPRKSSKRATRVMSGAGGPTSPLSPISTSGSETSLPVASATIRKVVPSSSQQQLRQPVQNQTQVPAPLQTRANAQAYPSPPNSGSATDPAQGLVHASTTKAAQPLSAPGPYEIAPAAAASPPQPIRRKPPPSSSSAGSNNYAPAPPVPQHAAHPSTSSSVYSHHPEFNHYEAQPPAFSQPQPHQQPAASNYSLGFGSGVDDAWTQPPSRFSVTTYATSAHTGSARPSLDEDRPPVPPMPTPPQHHQASMLDRKRPRVAGNWAPNPKVSSEPIVISMTTPYMSSPFTTSNGTVPERRPAPRSDGGSGLASPTSPSDLSKALPLAPPEMENVHDRVAFLNARLEALGNRRININKSIKQMTELMPTDSLVASEAVIRKRVVEKRKVETLKQELADVQREEYELGLKLHRAYKRLDRDAEFEPTTLWVRRVTG